jgi:hypothetical protein
MEIQFTRRASSEVRTVSIGTHSSPKVPARAQRSRATEGNVSVNIKEYDPIIRSIDRSDRSEKVSIALFGNIPSLEGKCVTSLTQQCHIFDRTGFIFCFLFFIQKKGETSEA